MDEQSLQQIEQIVGHKFSNNNLLARAFTHSSAVENRLDSNERLEFLGDAVLSAVICQSLFDSFDNYLEGELTKIKSALVSRGSCARVARQLGLVRFLKVGKGMGASKTLPMSLAAGLLEAIIAAIYIDSGFDAARVFILRQFTPLIDQINAEESRGNYKSLLQQYAQEHLNAVPMYVLLDEKGPDHNKCFESEVVIAERHFTSAWGANKKQAEQKAAFNALVELGVVKDQPLGDD
jgi:ribonuclease-3